MQRYLPNAGQANVDAAKVRDYLLVHNRRGDKSGFFERFGFRRDEWEVLRAALLRHAATYPVVSIRPHEYGLNYVVEGPLETPGGRRPRVESVWLVTANEPNPWFVTARPSRRKAP